MNQQQYQTEFSRTIKIQSIGNKKYSISIEANSNECNRLAIRLGLNGLNSLSANLCLSPRKGGRIINLKGSFQADVIQTCVVTLENLSNKVEGSLDILYDSTLEVGNDKDEFLYFDELAETQDHYEPLIDGCIDIGEAVSEQLALEIDSFPRKKGVSFVQFSTEINEKRSSHEKSRNEAKAKNGPFSVLENLKKNKK